MEIEASPFKYLKQGALQGTLMNLDKIVYATGYEPSTTGGTEYIIVNQLIPYFSSPSYILSSDGKRLRKDTSDTINNVTEYGVQFKFDSTKETDLEKITTQNYTRIYFMTKYLCFKDMEANVNDINKRISMWFHCRTVLVQHWNTLDSNIDGMTVDDMPVDVPQEWNNTNEQINLQRISNAVLTGALFSEILRQNDDIQNNLRVLLNMHLSSGNGGGGAGGERKFSEDILVAGLQLKLRF